jgi:starch phosphorylase
MFAPYMIASITNGMHVRSWTSAPFQALFDRYISCWREDNFSLRYAIALPQEKEASDVSNARRLRDACLSFCWKYQAAGTEGWDST